MLILSYLPTVLNATRRVPEVFRSEVKFKFFAAINQILPVLIRGEHSGTRGGGGGRGRCSNHKMDVTGYTCLQSRGQLPCCDTSKRFVLKVA